MLLSTLSIAVSCLIVACCCQPPLRYVHTKCPEKCPDHKNCSECNPKTRFCTNYISTTKYSILNFLPIVSRVRFVLQIHVLVFVCKLSHHVLTLFDLFSFFFAELIRAVQQESGTLASLSTIYLHSCGVLILHVAKNAQPQTNVCKTALVAVANQSTMCGNLGSKPLKKTNRHHQKRNGRIVRNTKKEDMAFDPLAKSDGASLGETHKPVQNHSRSLHKPP